MKDSEGGYTIVLVPSDTQRTRSLRLSPRGLRIAAALAAGGGLALAVLLGSWWYFAAQTVRIPELEREIAQLEADNEKVEQLAENLGRLQAEYAKIRGMLGADVLASGVTPEILPSDEPAIAEEGTARTGLSPEIPTSWPLATAGFVTQVLEQAQVGTHPGIDIAVAQHSYVRAAGAGVVSEAGFDSIYGFYVLLEHGNTGYSTMYGHASRLFVAPGDAIRQNEVIALSGNTGRSTAPHLHFEILQDGVPIDPFTLVQQRTGT
ncbi:MAG: peptidoglycan DD-metalloendopeptidase family protein [Gemmatimonadota bacterium]|nr:MAG: peptidoglycan DD-metalloendopeptidase family protein [Gemmatimonadota bacterium]